MPFDYHCPVLSSHDHVLQINPILDSALQAVDPYKAVRTFVRLENNHLQIAERVYDLRSIDKILIVGVGKAARPMTQALVDLLGDRITGGAVITKHAISANELIGRVEVLEGDHPLPSVNSQRSAERLIPYLQGLSPFDLVICPISGGGSALTAALPAGISIDDLTMLNAALLACGAAVQEINILRKHLDTIKGGGLARYAAPAFISGLILSDVVGNPLPTIASGPTVPDPSSFGDAWGIIQKYRLEETIPSSICNLLLSGCAGKIADTPKPGNPIFDRVQNSLVGSNIQAAQAAIRTAQKLGLQTMLLTTFLQGEARSAGQFLASILRQEVDSGNPIPRPACVVVGGETTVTIRGAGRGGRNQELALSAVAELAGLNQICMITLATDGEDGPTDAAGAIITGDTFQSALDADLDIRRFLENNDSFTFFDRLGCLLKPGPTGTNVNDLTFLFAF